MYIPCPLADKLEFNKRTNISVFYHLTQLPNSSLIAVEDDDHVEAELLGDQALVPLQIPDLVFMSDARLNP